VRERIRRFTAARGQSEAPVRGRGEEPSCDVELTEFLADGRTWWTLGFEATGPASQLRTELEATAALVFAQALPGGMELGTDHSQSYAQWLTEDGPEHANPAVASAIPPSAVPPSAVPPSAVPPSAIPPESRQGGRRTTSPVTALRALFPESWPRRSRRPRRKYRPRSAWPWRSRGPVGRQRF